jgi:hypothetical protein
MRQAYIEILQAMERAYAMLIEHGLASKHGMAEHQFQAMTRFHQLLKWSWKRRNERIPRTGGVSSK